MVAQIRKSLYVDDLISGASTMSQTQQLKEGSIKIFGDAKFVLHKWNSNAAELERDRDPGYSEDLSFAKQQLGSPTTLAKLLGLPWNKIADTLSICFPHQLVDPTNRAIFFWSWLKFATL